MRSTSTWYLVPSPYVGLSSITEGGTSKGDFAGYPMRSCGNSWALGTLGTLGKGAVECLPECVQMLQMAPCRAAGRPNRQAEEVPRAFRLEVKLHATRSVPCPPDEDGH